MAEIVNLRMARKRRDRAAAEAKASENRALHGRSKAESDRLKAVSERAIRDLDGHLLLSETDAPERS